MSAISTRQPEVDVYYDTPNGRTTKHFKNAFKAKSFYVKQDKLGNNPSVKRSKETMSDTPTQTPKQDKKTPKKRTPKKPTPKKRTPKKSLKSKTTAKKKTPTPKKRAAAGEKPDYLRKPQLGILRFLGKSKSGQTREQILDAVSCNLSEHLGSTSGKENKYTRSLLEWKYVKAEQEDIGGKDVILFQITALGRKELEKQSD